MRKLLAVILVIAAVLTMGVRIGLIGGTKDASANGKVPHEYEVVVESLSWEEASAAAIECGGHLATITSQEEFEEVVGLCEPYGDDIKCFWLGGMRDGDTYKWCTGEKVSDKYWYPGEPSYHDTDGRDENYICLWPLDDWSFNDQANELPYASAYVVEYE